MESMNLFENDSAAPKDNLIHYQGELGDLCYILCVKLSVYKVEYMHVFVISMCVFSVGKIN